ADAARLPVQGGRWAEVTGQPFQAEPPGYNDPAWSNSGAGFDLVGGRMTALAIDSGGTVVYAAAADGGVWRSTNGGRTWTALFQDKPTLSTGALLVDPTDHSLWVGTGEANTNSDAYQGQGVYRSTDLGRTFRKVGGAELDTSQVFRLVRDGYGHVYAATTRGLWRRSGAGSSPWQLVLKPDPNPTRSPYRTSFVTDVEVKPGTGGKVVLAALAWRLGTPYNGFYLSTDGGVTFAPVTPTGDIRANDIGRTTFAYSADGTRLYAVVQSVAKVLAAEDTVLQGVYVSKNGDPAGPWTRIADSASLGASGSALQNLEGYHVGVQAWYNQTLLVDPANRDHVYLGLEEVFETDDGGATWRTAAQYWNYGLPAGLPKTTHPDQHALAIAGGEVWSGNDGGVYHRPLSVRGYGSWINTNATLRTLQYYGAGTGRLRRGVAYWGGLQDNGTSVLNGRDNPLNIEPAGADGGQMLVDPKDGRKAVGEYVNLALYLTTDGGQSFRTISPTCAYVPKLAACDPAARFLAPFTADVDDPSHWVAGGSQVWDDTKAWGTTCTDTACDWASVHDLGLDSSGAPNLATALAVNGKVTYAAWVGGGSNPGPAFASGIDTNYGGRWHRVTAPNLPQRFIAGMQVDRADPAHVSAIYNGYSRRWIPGGGVGHVFESRDGGATWTDVSGTLPDVAGCDLVIVGKRLVLATDAGVFVADQRSPARWARLGVGLPNSSTNDLTVAPDGHSVVAATHGRGLWEIKIP
ncbi:MAG TPA: hypothetical protein VKP11_10110, partial [Frankiaceae bacterium]|nr:hypothetical protein [Frankiaceae bacterium]